jgi:NADPH:quinone reductase-like Zn-dependent oxidoreductase
MRLLSFSIRRKARNRQVSYSFLFMRANGEQLTRITALIEAGIIRPVVDRVFAFAAINEALAHVETGRSKGKVVIKLR